MASSARASSSTSRLLAALRRPSAFFAATWAGLLAGVTLVGVAPGLAGVTRVVNALDRHADEGFVTPLRQVRATWRRDLPVSLAFVVAAVLTVADVALVTQVDPRTRVAVVGFLVPVVWSVGVLGTAYVMAASAQPFAATRDDVLGLAAVLLRRRPVRAALTPLLLVALLPVAVVPFTAVAVGLSGPAWVVAEWWGVRPWRDRLDPDPRTAPAADPPDLEARWRRLGIPG